MSRALFAFSLVLIAALPLAALDRVPPSSAGVEPAAIRDIAERLSGGDFDKGNANSFLLVKDDKIIAEAAWAPYRVDDRRDLFSVTKSFTSVAIGFAVQENLLKLSDPVIGFFPEQRPKEVSPRLAAMTVRDLLTMQTGHADCVAKRMFDAPDVATGFFAAEIAYDPGTRFVYNSGASHMLSAIVTKLTGKSAFDYLKPRLFEPLGITDVKWESDKQGVSTGGWGIQLKMEDAAKFGLFCLYQGKWNGKQLLNAEYMKQATSRQCATEKDKPAEQGYGYQFWVRRPGLYFATGFLGQQIIVLTEKKAVLVMYNSNRQFRILQYLEMLQKMERADYPGADHWTDRQLADYLAKLALSFPEDAASKLGFRPGPTLEIALPEGNETHIINLKLAFGDRDCQVTTDGHAIRFGHREWQANPPLEMKPDEFPLAQVPLAAGFYQTGPRTLCFRLVSPGSAMQNEVTVELLENEAKVTNRWSFDQTAKSAAGKLVTAK